MFQGSRRRGASPEILFRDGDPGHAVRDKERGAAVRRNRHDHNRHHLRPLRAHISAYVPNTLPAHQDAADDIRRDCARGLSLRTQVHQALGDRQQDIREHSIVRDVRERYVRLRRVHCRVP